jgi:hypothetical protein
MDNPQAYLRPPRSVAWQIWMICAVAVAASAWLGLQAYLLLDYVDTRSAANLRAAARSTVRPQPKPNRAEQDAARLWAELEAERDFPWSHIFKMVEQSDSTEIALLGLTPDKRHRTVMLRGQALTQKALLAYLKALGEQPMLSQVYLVHQQAMNQNQLETIAFEIKIRLR